MPGLRFQRRQGRHDPAEFLLMQVGRAASFAHSLHFRFSSLSVENFVKPVLPIFPKQGRCSQILDRAAHEQRNVLIEMVCYAIWQAKKANKNSYVS